MKLLLDEMWSPAVAEQLKRRGHDAIASLERDDLRRLSDEAVLNLARSLRRVVVTRDVGDYAELARRLRSEERDHHGVVLVSPRRFSAAAEGVGSLVRALNALLQEHKGDDDFVNDVVWLESGTPWGSSFGDREGGRHSSCGHNGWRNSREHAPGGVGSGLSGRS